jgi:hypothetical protein
MRQLIIVFIFCFKLIAAQEVQKNLFGFATSNTFTYCDINDTSFMNKVTDLNPKVLRFPGGAVGNYYHFGGSGYGFDFQEIEKYDAGKFLKRSKGLVRDAYKKGHTHDYINDFIVLAKATNSQVILVANMFVDNDDIIKMITKIIANDIEIIGVELGSELTNRYFFEKGYTIDDYLISAKRCSNIIKLNFPKIQTAIVAAPLGKPKNHRHNIWNNKLSKLDYYDAVIVHSYAKVITGKDLFGQMILEEDEGLSKKETFNMYKSRVINFFANDLPDEIKRYNTIFNKPIWVTEWNLQMSKTTGNTMFQSLFVSNYLLEILSNKDLANISITTYHNLAGRTVSGSIFKGDNESFITHSTYFPFSMLSDLFEENIIQIKKNKMKDKHVYVYNCYNSDNKIQMIYIINWSNKDFDYRVNKNMNLFNSFYSKNLYDRANEKGMLSSDSYMLGGDYNLLIRPYSISVIEGKNE